MGNVRVIDVHQSVYAVNDEIAAKTRARLKEEKTFMVNLMSSPGAGKTTTLIRTANMLGDRYRIGVMEADIDSSVDAEKMAAAGGYFNSGAYRRRVCDGRSYDHAGT